MQHAGPLKLFVGIIVLSGFGYVIENWGERDPVNSFINGVGLVVTAGIYLVVSMWLSVKMVDVIGPRLSRMLGRHDNSLDDTLTSIAVFLIMFGPVVVMLAIILLD